MKKTNNNRIQQIDDIKNDIKNLVKTNSNRYLGIVIHTAEYFLKSNTKELAFEIDKWHLQRGWTGIGYAFVVERSGNIYVTNRFINGINQAHALGSFDVNETTYTFNADTIGICISGDGNSQTMSQSQKDSLLKLIWMLKINIPSLSFIIPHGIIKNSNKSCPGFYVSLDLGDMAEVLKYAKT